jgi:hypothetical protein
MKYINLFESFNILKKNIEDIFKTDPYLLRDIIISSLENNDINGNLEMIYFSFLYPYPESRAEEKVIFELSENKLKKGLYYENKESIIESDRYKMIITIFIDESDFNKIDNFHLDVNKHLERADIPYSSWFPTYTDRIGNLTPIKFDYTWGYKKNYNDN